jgi:galactonate dehydratase
MRITGISTLVVDGLGKDWIFVKVETDQAGLHGWGEATCEWQTRAVVGCIADLADMVVGRDPRDVANAVQAMMRLSYWPLGIIGMTAVSGIEQALWDIAGKAVGLPAWRLLGGKCRERVRVYARLNDRNPRLGQRPLAIAESAEEARRIVERGYNAIKLSLVPFIHYSAGLGELKQIERWAEAIRNAVGEEVDLMCDFTGRPESVRAAADTIKAMAPARLVWAEEPLVPGEPDAMRRIADMVDTAIATGERLASHLEFEELIRAGGVTYVQPDLCHVGGLLCGQRIAATAASHYVGVCPHNPYGAISGAAALHFAVATPNFVIQEEASERVPWFHDVVSSPIRREDGYWQVPETPGLGVEVNLKEAAKHPYKPEFKAPHFKGAVSPRDGSIVNW